MRSEDEKLYDIRLTDRNLRDGTVEQEQLDGYDAKLPDLTENADWVSYDDITSLRVAPLAAREHADDDEDDSPAED